MQQVVLVKVIGFSRSEGFEAGTPIASFRGDAARTWKCSGHQLAGKAG